MDLPTGEDSIFVNPKVRVWSELLRNELEFDKDWLGRRPPAVSADEVRGLPTVKDFQKDTSGGKLHFRHQILKAMDNYLKNYHAGQNPPEQLRMFLASGQHYLDVVGNSEGLEAKVRSYVISAWGG